jgi:hypothetical protein
MPTACEPATLHTVSGMTVRSWGAADAAAAAEPRGTPLSVRRSTRIVLCAYVDDVPCQLGDAYLPAASGNR